MDTVQELQAIIDDAADYSKYECTKIFTNARQIITRSFQLYRDTPMTENDLKKMVNGLLVYVEDAMKYNIVVGATGLHVKE